MPDIYIYAFTLRLTCTSYHGNGLMYICKSSMIKPSATAAALGVCTRFGIFAVSERGKGVDYKGGPSGN